MEKGRRSRVFGIVCESVTSGTSCLFTEGFIWAIEGCIVEQLVIIFYQLKALGLKFSLGHIFCFYISASLAPLANSALISTPTVHCECEDRMARERTDQ